MKRHTRFASRSFPSPGKTSSRAAGALLAVTLVLAAVPPAIGQVRRWLQPESLPPVVNLYNIGATEFPVGAWVHALSPVDRVVDHWPFAASMGFDIVNPTLFWRWDGEEGLKWNWMLQLDTLFESPYATDSGLRWWGGPDPIGMIGGKDLAAGGQAIELYPFDSTQTGPVTQGTDRAYWLFAGVDTAKGSIQYNDYYRLSPGEQIDRWIWPWKGEYNPGERIYEDSADAGLIAEHIAFVDPAPYAFYDPYAVSRPSQNASVFLDIFGGAGNNDLHTVLTGRMILADGPANATDTIFVVKLYHEVPDGGQYLDDALTTQTASGFTEIVIDSFAVTKGELMRGFPDTNIAEYREGAHRTDLRYKFNDPNRVGVLHPGQLLLSNGSRRIDVKVHWTGKERAALRSISLRNPIAEMMMGKTQQSVDFRKEVLDTARRVLHGLDANGDIDLSAPHRAAVLAFDSGHELFSTGSTTWAAVNRYLSDSLVYNNGADSVPAWMIDIYPSVHPTYHHITEDRVIHMEINYLNGWGQYHPQVSVPFDTIPSIAEHNGGVFGPPELLLTPDSIEMYTESWQHGYYGWFDPDADAWTPYLPRMLMDLGVGAQIARDKGRRMFPILGVTSFLELDTANVTWSGDVLTNHEYVFRLSHLVEPAELRMVANLSLCYGASGIQYWTVGTQLNAMGDKSMFFPGSGDTLAWGVRTTFGPVGEHFGDTTADVVDLTLTNHDIWSPYYVPDGQMSHVVSNVYTGWKSRSAEMRALNGRTKEIGEEMMRRGLRWREGYSVHHQARRPNSSDYDQNFPGVRTLSQDEIVTEATSRHPITGKIDSAWATYVELGLFYTVTDTSDDATLDTNYVYVVNRRTFERGADVPDTSLRGRLMDTLSETRIIRLRFNLPHPDSTQYSFIRVREVLPDTTHLPLIGARSILDSVIYGVDSCVEITLGAGRAALLEVTYTPPDESIVDGRLAFNNQRKLIYGLDDKWHAVYLRNDSVLYRRSMKAGPDPGSILWEPVEALVSTDTIMARFENWFPSMTMRVHNGDTIATVVWSTHTTDSAAAFLGMRDVVVRDLNLTQGTRSNIWWVDFHWGRDSTQWGDVVVNAARGGDFIAWGDSLTGILARVRKLGPFGFPPQFSAQDSVSWAYHPCGKVARWPTVPTFAHIASADSNCGIAYNQPQCGGGSHICYQRLQHVVLGGGTPGLANLNYLTVSAAPGDLGRPSMDQTQDVWHRVQEGVTWVEDIAWQTPSKIWFRSLFTETRNRPGWDSIEMTQGWGIAWTTGAKWGVNGDSWPNTGALNEVFLVPDSAKEAHFAVAFVHTPDDPTPTLRQGIIKYSEASFKTGWPLTYAYRGDYPHGSASPVTQSLRHGVLYETTLPSSGPVLRSTRQFFGAKSRPTGYIAEGRQVILRLSDSIPTGFTGLLHDVWLSDADGGRPLELVKRNHAARTDALSDARELLRTEMFRTHDSVEIGYEIDGRFFGDAGIGGDAEMRLIAELIDSATGAVVYGIDSVEVSADDDSAHVLSTRLYDLLTGTYYVRVRLDTSAIQVVERTWESRYPVAECASYVESEIAGKMVRRVEGMSGAAARISAQPNPFGRGTEVRFSTPRRDYVSVTVFDAFGRKIAMLVDRELFEPGRYAMEFDGERLPAGTYIVELRTSTERVVEKVMLRR